MARSDRRLHSSDSAVDASAAPTVRRGGRATHAKYERDIATFYFDDGVLGGSSGRGPPPAWHARFRADFFRELAAVGGWAAERRWYPSAIENLRVLVGDRHVISRSLAPAWYGHSGHMEFPARRAIAGQAAIAHELTHVLFPNGNRLLAEGLAVYLQAEIGGNPAFPNFGRPLHELARQRLREMAPRIKSGDPGSLDDVRLSELDKVATPAPLELRVGADFYGEEPRGQTCIYALAGSFIAFLIETRGLERFRALFERTPLVPRARNGGSPGRWTEVYGQSLADLELEWKTLMVSPDVAATCDDGPTGLHPAHDSSEP
jgi:hypothetical protein